MNAQILTAGRGGREGGGSRMALGAKLTHLVLFEKKKNEENSGLKHAGFENTNSPQCSRGARTTTLKPAQSPAAAPTPSTGPRSHLTATQQLHITHHQPEYRSGYSTPNGITPVTQKQAS